MRRNRALPILAAGALAIGVGAAGASVASSSAQSGALVAAGKQHRYPAKFELIDRTKAKYVNWGERYKGWAASALGVGSGDQQSGFIVLYSLRKSNRQVDAKLVAQLLRPDGSKRRAPVVISRGQGFGSAASVAWNEQRGGWMIAYREYRNRWPNLKERAVVQWVSEDGSHDAPQVVDPDPTFASDPPETSCNSRGACLIAWSDSNGRITVNPVDAKGEIGESRRPDGFNAKPVHLEQSYRGLTLGARPKTDGFVVGYVKPHPRGDRSTRAVVLPLTESGDKASKPEFVSPAPRGRVGSRRFTTRSFAPNFCTTKSGQLVAVYRKDIGSQAVNDVTRSAGFGVQPLRPSGSPKGRIRNSAVLAGKYEGSWARIPSDGACTIAFESLSSPGRTSMAVAAPLISPRKSGPLRPTYKVTGTRSVDQWESVYFAALGKRTVSLVAYYKNVSLRYSDSSLFYTAARIR